MKIKKIYYINLKKDTLRRAIIEECIALHFPNIPCERVEAVGKDDLIRFEDVFLNRLTKSWKPIEGVYPKPGGIGCYLSHEICRKKIMHEINSTGSKFDEYFMVLEDDCIIGKDFVSLISDQNFLSSIPSEAKVLKPVARKFDEAHKVNNFFYDVSKSKELDYNYYFGTHMLLYRSSSMGLTTLELNNLPVFDIDWLVNKKLNGVYAFGEESRSFVMQTNLNGSNTLE